MEYQYPTGIDVWSDENAPYVSHNAYVYFLRLPYTIMPTLRAEDINVIPFCYIEVDSYGWVSITSYHWFGKVSSSGKRHDVVTAILHYLQEWEYVELRKIGPEDAEWFATEKLLNLPKFRYEV